MAHPNACRTQRLFIINLILNLALQWSSKQKEQNSRLKKNYSWKNNFNIKKPKKAFQVVTQFGNLRKMKVCVQEETALGIQRNGKSCLGPIFEPCLQPYTRLHQEKVFLDSNRAHTSRGLRWHYEYAQATHKSLRGWEAVGWETLICPWLVAPSIHVPSLPAWFASIVFTSWSSRSHRSCVCWDGGGDTRDGNSLPLPSFPCLKLGELWIHG